ncbi:hypothetical protein ES332_D05G437800v1 [Gossypium tomentosum]|uniref:Uncharacterized protein n=2 Tax=Gossypium TaxID=3633 RepID=A0A0D2U4I1_GOSRA|nr:hypothetical protein B456_009G441200 [Gossypium raimondii]TYH74934.1 hypothetical protein ES332_D05G437800v1 [Gossypium tomentosum]
MYSLRILSPKQVSNQTALTYSQLSNKCSTISSSLPHISQIGLGRHLLFHNPNLVGRALEHHLHKKIFSLQGMNGQTSLSSPSMSYIMVFCIVSFSSFDNQRPMVGRSQLFSSFLNISATLIGLS